MNRATLHAAVGGVFLFPDKASCVESMPKICRRFAGAELPETAYAGLETEVVYEGRQEAVLQLTGTTLLEGMSIPGAACPTWAQVFSARAFFDNNLYAQEWIGWIGIKARNFNLSVRDGSELSARFNERVFAAFEASNALEMIGPNISHVLLVQEKNPTHKIWEFLWPLHASVNFVAGTVTQATPTVGKRGVMLSSWRLDDYVSGGADEVLDRIAKEAGKKGLSKIWKIAFNHPADD